MRATVSLMVLAVLVASGVRAVWAGVVAMWRASGVRIPTSIPCAGCGTEVPVPPVSHLGHGKTRRDIATP